MDLVLTDASGTDLMVLSPDSSDWEWGGDDGNDFELTFEEGRPVPAFRPFGRVWAQGTEYGGVLTRVSSEGGCVKWSGPTWTGLLAGKVLVDDAGTGRLTVSGEANAVLRQLVARMDLAEVLAGSAEQSGIRVVSYGFDMYADGYSGVTAMLASVGAKLRVRHDGARAVLSAVPAVDWSASEEFDATMVEVEATVERWFVNHLVGRGQDEKENRVSVDLYLDDRGNVSEKRSLAGIREHSEYYNYTSADRDKLVEDGTKRLKGYWDDAQTVSVTLAADDDRFDIGDVVAGIDPRTGVTARARITSKVLTTDRHGVASVSYGTE